MLLPLLVVDMRVGLRDHYKRALYCVTASTLTMRQPSGMSLGPRTMAQARNSGPRIEPTGVQRLTTVMTK